MGFLFVYLFLFCFNFDEVQFFTFLFMVYAFGILYQNFFPNPRLQRFFSYVFFQKSYSLTLIFRFVCHVNFCVQCEIGSNLIIFACGCPVVPASFVGSTVSPPPLNYPNTVIKNQLTRNIRTYIWTLISVPLIYMPLLTPVPLCLNFCGFTLSFEIRK